MLFSLLSVLVPLASSLLGVGLAIFVLAQNRKAWANRWLALGLITISSHEGFTLMSQWVAPAWRLAAFKLALAIIPAIPATWLAFSLTFGEKNGGSHLARWRPALLGLTAVLPLAWIAFALGRIVEIQTFHRGTSAIALLGLDGWGKAYLSVYLLGLALVLVHLESLYRYAAQAIRHRIRFLVFGVFLAFGFQIIITSHALLYGIIHPLSSFLGGSAFLLSKVMMAFALVRHRLLDVHVFVSRYVVYRSFTMALVGGYLLSLGVVAEVFRRLDITLDLLTGMFFALLGGVALALLLVSAEFRRRLQRFISIHFYKEKYHYRLEWMELTRRLSRTTDIPSIAAHTVDRILEVMGIRQGAMYVTGESPGQLALAYQCGYDGLPATLAISEVERKTLRASAETLASTGSASDPPGDESPLVWKLFRQTKAGRLVPIVTLDTLVGLLLLGPDLSGGPLSPEDKDLLAAVTAQAGALVENARLSQEASESRDLQVLSRLSAFVAHDLKNAVSMLSMLAENAKIHISKAEFQVDAIRTLSDVTSKMRTLLATLAAPGNSTRTCVRPINLASSVDAWMKEISSQVPSRIRIQTRLGWAPEVRVDPEQFRSVLHNLVVNAIEAIPADGTIFVETAQEDGYAMLAVSDTGRGMTQDFIRQRLFRPFQTTKLRGLGIGLYQCRHIVLGVGGTLTAESQEGRGTRMLVRLPAAVVSPQLTALTD